MRRKHRYIIYKPSDDQSSIEVEKASERDETWETFLEAVPENEAR